MPTTVRDDLRYLATIDRRHSRLADVTDGWFQRTGYPVLSVRAGDGTPLVAVALAYPSPCPVDPTATVQIKYWLANLERPGELQAALVQNIIAIQAQMTSTRVRRVWGAVPKSATHLTDLLDPVAEAGACAKVEGTEDWANAYFYIGDRDTVAEFVRRARP